MQIKLPQLCLQMKRGWPSVQNFQVLKHSVLSSTLSTSLLVGDKFPQFSVSLSVTHIVHARIRTRTHTHTPFTTIDLTSPLWGRWLLSLVLRPHFLSRSCFRSWQSSSSRYTASFPLSWQRVKMFIPSSSSSSYSCLHIRITERAFEKCWYLLEPPPKAIKSESLGVGLGISIFLNSQVIPVCS